MSALPTCGLERAAALLHCHESTAAELARAGKIRGRKVGRAWVFVEADILQFIREGDCRSTSEAACGGSTSRMPDSDIDALLASVKSRVRSESTTSSAPSCGSGGEVVELSTARSRRGRAPARTQGYRDSLGTGCGILGRVGTPCAARLRHVAPQSAPRSMHADPAPVPQDDPSGHAADEQHGEVVGEVAHRVGPRMQGFGAHGHQMTPGVADCTSTRYGPSMGAVGAGRTWPAPATRGAGSAAHCSPAGP